MRSRGTPTQAGTFNIQIKMTDGLGNTATQNYTLTIDDILTITTASLPNGTVGVPYSQAVATSNGVGQVELRRQQPAHCPQASRSIPAPACIRGTPSAHGAVSFHRCRRPTLLPRHHLAGDTPSTSRRRR